MPKAKKPEASKQKKPEASSQKEESQVDSEKKVSENKQKPGARVYTSSFGLKVEWF